MVHRMAAMATSGTAAKTFMHAEILYKHGANEIRREDETRSRVSTYLDLSEIEEGLKPRETMSSGQPRPDRSLLLRTTYEMVP